MNPIEVIVGTKERKGRFPVLVLQEKGEISEKDLIFKREVEFSVYTRRKYLGITNAYDMDTNLIQRMYHIVLGSFSPSNSSLKFHGFGLSFLDHAPKSPINCLSSFWPRR